MWLLVLWAGVVALVATTVVALRAPGSHPFECTVPGHAAAGMRGTLQVVGDDAGPSGSPMAAA